MTTPTPMCPCCADVGIHDPTHSTTWRCDNYTCPVMYWDESKRSPDQPAEGVARDAECAQVCKWKRMKELTDDNQRILREMLATAQPAGNGDKT